MLKEKLAGRNPASVVTENIDTPWKILKLCEELEVSMYITFINKLLFLVSIRKGFNLLQ